MDALRSPFIACASKFEPVMSYWTSLFHSEMLQTMNMWQGTLLADFLLSCCCVMARVLCKVSV
jgi:hypothetical protein